MSAVMRQMPLPGADPARPVRRRRSLQSLVAINRRAREDAFRLEDLDWSAGVDRGRPWEPESLGPACFLPEFAALGPAHRIRCNQLHALGVCEQFIWFEGLLIRTAQRVLAGAALPAPLEEALHHFIEDERKHTAMFSRLLALAEPQWYAHDTSHLFRLSASERATMDLLVRWPRTVLSWIWLAILVEERTLFLSREYLRAEKRDPGCIDPLHVQVHAFHFRDEVRHYHLDQHLLTWMYDAEPAWKRTLAARTFHPMVRSLVRARRTTEGIFATLGREFPELRATALPRLRTQLRGVRHDAGYHRRMFSRAALPHTLALLREYPEHAGLWEMLPAAREDGR